MPQQNPQVSTIIVIHNSRSVIEACLRDLQTAVANLTGETIIIDNNSADDGADLSREINPTATVVRNEENLGFARACNQAAGLARGEMLLFLNPDVSCDPDSIEQLYAAAETRPRAGLITARLRNQDGSFQATCRHFPTISNMLFARGSVIAGRFGKVDKSVRYTLPDFDEPTSVPAVSGAMIMIRRSTFEEVNGFDPRFFMYMEDTDLSLRLIQSKYENWFEPSAGGVHLWGGGSTARRSPRLWYHHISIWKYFLKHSPNGFSILVLPFLLAGHFLLRLLIRQPREKN